MVKNYYLILGIGEGATPEEIRRAYRRKARALHPDNYGPEHGPFLDVQEAYEVLSDAARRRAYDRSHGYGLRQARVREYAGGARRAPVEPVEPVEAGEPAPRLEISLTRSFQTARPSFEEIFDRLWGNFFGGPRPKAEHVEGLTVDVPVTPEQVRRGGEVRILVPASAGCPACGGRGGVGPFACGRCGGAGRITGEFPVRVAFPAGTPDGHAVSVSLEHLGIRNMYLTVRFCVG